MDGIYSNIVNDYLKNKKKQNQNGLKNEKWFINEIFSIYQLNKDVTELFETDYFKRFGKKELFVIQSLLKRNNKIVPIDNDPFLTSCSVFYKELFDQDATGAAAPTTGSGITGGAAQTSASGTTGASSGKSGRKYSKKMADKSY